MRPEAPLTRIRSGSGMHRLSRGEAAGLHGGEELGGGGLRHRHEWESHLSNLKSERSDRDLHGDRVGLAEEGANDREVLELEGTRFLSSSLEVEMHHSAGSPRSDVRQNRDYSASAQREHGKYL